jgi:hypothetical protein
MRLGASIGLHITSHTRISFAFRLMAPCRAQSPGLRKSCGVLACIDTVGTVTLEPYREETCRSLLGSSFSRR